MLGDVDSLRQRVRRERRPDSLWAGLVGIVAMVGAASFIFGDQLQTRSCQETELGRTCAVGISSFDHGWVWLVASVVAFAVPYVLRHRRGSWRPSTATWIALAVVSLFVLPGAIPLLSALHPIVYPLAAAFAIGAVAVLRRDFTVGVTAAVVGAVAAYVEFRVDAAFLLQRNIGLTLSSLAVASLSFAAAGVWRRPDRPE